MHFTYTVNLYILATILSLTTLFQVSTSFEENIDFCWITDNYSYIINSGMLHYTKMESTTFTAVQCTNKQLPSSTSSVHTEYQNIYSYLMYFASNMSNFERILEEVLNTSQTCHWNVKHIIYPVGLISETIFQSSVYQLNLNKLNWNNHIYFIFPSKYTKVLNLWEAYSFKNFTITNNLNSFILTNVEHQIAKALKIRGFTRNDFGGTELLVLGEDDPDYQSELAYKPFTNTNNSPEFASGLFAELLWDLETMLNFTMRPVVGKGWISQDAKGSLTGMGHQILSGEADVSASFSQLAEYRSKHLYFLHPTFAGRDYTFFRQPEFTTHDKLLTAFQPKLWFGLGITWILIITTHIFIQQVRCRNESRETLFSEIITLVAGITAQMGVWNWQKIDQITRIVQFFGILMCAILYIAYAATLVSHLTRIKVPINNFDDLIRYNYIFLSTPRVSLIRFYVSVPEQADKLLEISKKYYINESHSVAQVLSSPDPFAYINTLDTFFLYAKANNFSNTQICSTMFKVSSGQHRNKCGMFIRKDSPLREAFNVKILISMERGLTSRSVQQYTAKETLNCEKPSIQLKPARLEDLYVASVTLLCGIVISWVLCLIEVSISRASRCDSIIVTSVLTSDPRLVFRK